MIPYSDTWATEQEFFDLLNDYFSFQVDICADDTNKKLKNFIGFPVDALSIEWNYTSVFCNPPYSNIAAFLEHGYFEYLNNRCSLILYILPVWSDSVFFQLYFHKFDYVVFLNKRIRFHGLYKSNTYASFGIMFGIFGLLNENQINFLKSLGIVIKPKNI